MLKAFKALQAAVVQAERELHEATSLPGVAESLRRSSLEELRCAQAVRNELALLGQDALYSLALGETAEDIRQEAVPLSAHEGLTSLTWESAEGLPQPAPADGTQPASQQEEVLQHAESVEGSPGPTPAADTLPASPQEEILQRAESVDGAPQPTPAADTLPASPQEEVLRREEFVEEFIPGSAEELLQEADAAAPPERAGSIMADPDDTALEAAIVKSRDRGVGEEPRWEVGDPPGIRTLYISTDPAAGQVENGPPS